eukprot:TRINITY_DN65211_c0_g1_i1.p1 TRINITY_DN65211_c0_g1~~TRINITY_DN65211_c0_g1_i1.p1  ORF type:complete len:100 (-),score=17.43 TRINITY_DN65211_c0_g1_i1:100-399(-)
MIRRPPRSTLSSSSAASDVYKRQMKSGVCVHGQLHCRYTALAQMDPEVAAQRKPEFGFCVQVNPLNLFTTDNNLHIILALEHVPFLCCLLYTSPSPRDS